MVILSVIAHRESPWAGGGFSVSARLVHSRFEAISHFLRLRQFLCQPYAIKNQRKARDVPSRGHFAPKPLVGGFGCLELVLYGIRELA